MLNVIKNLGMISGRIETQNGVRVSKEDFEYWGGIVHSNRGGFVDRLVDIGEKIKKETAPARVLDPFGMMSETIKVSSDGYL